MYLNTDHFTRHIVTLESSLTLLNRSEPESIDYEIFRNTVVKGFVLTLETGGKLLRKALAQIPEAFRQEIVRGGTVLVREGRNR
ncbi:hypothetical protein [Citrifermentans bremense]|uniref:hypothetical protein n=1 Tax=Citrifermentans bremense TaxID=60035 RepID=UPI0004097440|nr:hypothetical protein [Citrifermentans bremense]